MTGHIERTPEIAASIASVDRQIKWSILVAVALTLVGVVIAVWAVFRFESGSEELSRLGAFLAGTVGPVWAAAGLVLIYLAFLGQRRQILYQEEAIDLNRTELRDTREELRGQKEQLELQKKEMQIQNQLASKQAFESAFFQLLRFHRESINRLRVTAATGALYEGAEAFTYVAGELEGRLRIAILPPPSNEERLNLLNNAFLQLCLSAISDFGHYFRTLFHLIRLVDESSVEDKRRYTSLVRAQLSNAELLVLMVNGLSSFGRPKFKPLIERYALLEPVRLEYGYRTHKDLYDPAAFGDRAQEV